METAPREWSRLPAHCGQAVGERSAANREISDAANAASRGRRQTMTLKPAS
jgi:hypothetical protein